ncbi:Alpha/Beta hydrolase protein [Schizophyllum fasciatum]
MSDLYRTAMSARLAKLPPDLPPALDGEDDDEGEEEADSLGALPGSGLGPPPFPARTPRPARAPDPAFAPVSAAGFFQHAAQVALPARALDVRVYYSAPAGGALFVCHHGAGCAGLSFACFAREVAAMARGACGVLALDARRHGKTRGTAGAEDGDLSIGVLVDDFVALLGTMFPDPAAAPPFVLVGHSMGGSVVTRACPRLQESGYRITGVSVLDAVEGFALAALPHMHALLGARPDGFASAVTQHHAGAVTPQPTGGAATPQPTGGAATPRYVWRTPLRSTAAYWRGWFEGLSAAFLGARTARMLVLAGTDRLDKPLMIGQMQGKFQLEVVPDVGHLLHEDDPRRLAELHVAFWRRNERVGGGVKRVGDV